MASRQFPLKVRYAMILDIKNCCIPVKIDHSMSLGKGAKTPNSGVDHAKEIHYI